MTKETPETTPLVDEAVVLFARLADLPLPERVATLNQLRMKLAEHSPFTTEPVDLVQWVPAANVGGNNYNPNVVAPPEMELLRVSIMSDGYTQPIVVFPEEDAFEVVDGFHRHRVGRECEDVRQRVMDYLPVVVIRPERYDRPDRMASTIRHNRARGKHRVTGMSAIVLDLKRRNWSDTKIARELGMDPDEVLRLAQISGLAEAFKDREFSQAWEAEISAEGDDDILEALGESGEESSTATSAVSEAEPPKVTRSRPGKVSESPRQGWEDRTDHRSVFLGASGEVLSRLHQAPGRTDWKWTVYTAPMQEGQADTREGAKREAEAKLSR